SIFEIRRMLKDTKELIIDPEFQRNAVWKIEQERELIESVLMGIPIPIIYVFEEKDGKKQVVDGEPTGEPTGNQHGHILNIKY
ncbi:MAG: DUF262 domain-containing protein, partial [Thermodesulfobacteriota bacterium]|nr:DUF262 domain-containing protein [Thermodesulfobacteriota bacterium]